MKYFVHLHLLSCYLPVLSPSNRRISGRRTASEGKSPERSKHSEINISRDTTSVHSSVPTGMPGSVTSSCSCTTTNPGSPPSVLPDCGASCSPTTIRRWSPAGRIVRWMQTRFWYSPATGTGNLPGLKWRRSPRWRISVSISRTWIWKGWSEDWCDKSWLLSGTGFVQSYLYFHTLSVKYRLFRRYLNIIAL